MMRTAAAAALLTLAGCASGPSAPAAGRPSDPAPRAQATEQIAAAPRASAVLDAEPWTYEGKDGQIVRTRHYRIFTTESDALLAGRLPAFLEDALEHYRTAITPLPSPDLRLDCYLMDNRTQWARLTQRLLGNRAAPFLRIQRGGFATRGIGVYYDLGPFDTLAIAAHEGWHQYTQRVFRERLPTWLEEGLATYMEGHRWKGSTPVFLPWSNLERYDHLRVADDAGAIEPLSTFILGHGARSAGESSGLDFYAQAWAVAHFVASERREGLRRMLTDAVNGKVKLTLQYHARDTKQVIRGEAVVARAYFEAYFGDLETAQRDFDRFLAALIGPGSRDDVVRGRPPAAMSR